MSCAPLHTALLMEAELATSKPVLYSIQAVTYPQCASVSQSACTSSLSLLPTNKVPPIKATSIKPPPCATITRGLLTTLSVGGGINISITKSFPITVSEPRVAAISLGAFLL